MTKFKSFLNKKEQAKFLLCSAIISIVIHKCNMDF